MFVFFFFFFDTNSRSIQVTNTGSAESLISVPVPHMYVIRATSQAQEVATDNVSAKNRQTISDETLVNSQISFRPGSSESA